MTSYRLIALQTLSLVLTYGCGTKPKTELSNLSSNSEIQDWTDPMVLLRGYDEVSGSLRGDCSVAETPTPVLPGSSGNIGSWRIEYVTDLEQLNRSMDVSTSAGFKAATGGSASAKAKFSNSTNLNSYSVYALASVHVEKAAVNFSNVKLKPTYENLLNSTNPDKMKIFRTRCGDSFIGGQKSGGELLILIEIQSSSKEEKESISASVKGKAGPYSASGTFASALSELSQKYKLQINAFKVGGTSNAIPSEPIKMIERALAFEAEVDERHVPYKAILADYETLENFPFENPVSTANAITVLEELNKIRLTIKTNRSNISYILSNSSQFTGVKLTYLSGKINDLNAGENQIIAAAKECSENIDKCKMPTELPDISVDFPQWQDSTKPAQVFGEHESCGVEEFVTSAGEVCGVESVLYKFSSGPVCGVSGYNYNSGRGPACGAETFKESRGGACGEESFMLNIAASVNPRLDLVPDGRIDAKDCSAAGGKVATSSGMIPLSNCINVPVACRHESFGVETFKECADPSFGIRETFYNSCRDQSFGTEAITYKSCAHPTFGVKKYKSCLH